MRYTFIVATLLVGVTGILISARGSAQTDPSVPSQQAPGTGPANTEAIEPTPSSQSNLALDKKARFKAINKLTWKGWATPVPTYDDTILGDDGNWRTKLADLGIGASLWSFHNVSYDVAGAGTRYPSQQLYNGQKFNLITSSETAFLTYDLGRIGLEGGQLNVGAIATANGYQARNGPRHLNVRHVYWYQPVAKGRVELELGWITNQLDFIGIYVGGSLAGGTLGPQASLPVQAGISFGSFSAPTASARINWTKTLYTRTAIQRSLSPQGPTVERRNNRSGLAWSVPGAKPLLIQEVGSRVAPAVGQLSHWFRGGVLHNFSQYQTFDGQGTKNNQVFYVLADQQITQPNSQSPGQGIYAGASFNAGDASVNIIDRYYEGRVYVKGPFVSRPSDMISVVYGLNHYSKSGRIRLPLDMETPYRSTSSVTASYSYKVANGLYVQPGVGITEHPVYNRDIGTVVNALLGINVFF